MNSILSKVFILLSIFVSIVWYGCRDKKEDPKPIVYNVPTLTETKAASAIEGNSAMSGGTVSEDGGTSVLSRGLCWNTTGNPTIADKISANASGLGSFDAKLRFLYPNTTYFVKAYAVNSAGVGYGPVISFKTGILPGTCTTNSVVIIDKKTARMGGTVSDGGDEEYTNKGFCFSLKPNPTIEFADSVVYLGPGEGNFSGLVSELSFTSRYYFRAFGINSKGVIYGQEETFAIFEQDENFKFRRLLTLEATNIGTTSVTLGGLFTEFGNKLYENDLDSISILYTGFCWSREKDKANIAGFYPFKATNTPANPIGRFTLNITQDITQGDTHFVKSYVGFKKKNDKVKKDSIYYIYGNEISFIAKKTLPVVSIIEFSNNPSSQNYRIGRDTATIRYKNINNGGGTMTALGICYSTSPRPDINSEKVFASGNISNDSLKVSVLRNLLPNTKYFLRAFGTNELGTSYDATDKFFTTRFTAPALSTNSIEEITVSSAKTGGNISESGLPAYTERGVCYGLSPNPTTSPNKVSDPGTGPGAFTVSLTGLNAGQTYYLRAYAIASTGTVYGNQLTFTTISNVPIVTTSEVSNIVDTTATGGGEIINVGTPPYTEKGVCFDTTTSPTILQNPVVGSGTGTGVFTVPIVGLKRGKTYYIRAYAKNSNGVVYGEEKSFVTSF